MPICSRLVQFLFSPLSVRQAVCSVSMFIEGNWSKDRGDWRFCKCSLVTRSMRTIIDFSPEHSISPSSIDLSSHLLLSIRRKRLHNTLFPSCLLFASTLGRLHCELVRLLCLLAHRETDRLFASSGVDLVQTNLDSSTTSALLFTPSSNIVWQHPRQVHKFTALRINLNIYGALIASHSHAYPSEAHSQTSQFPIFFPLLRYPLPKFPRST